MQKLKSTLLSLGAAIATAKLVHLASALELDDVLRPVGLSRRSSRWPAHLAILGAGILLGGAGALLLAPTTGEQARLRLAKKAGEIGDAAVKQARRMAQEIGTEASLVSPRGDNGRVSTTNDPT